MEIVYVDKYALAKAAGLDNDLLGDDYRRIDGAVDIRVLDACPELAARVKAEGGAVSAYKAGSVGYDIITVAEMLHSIGVQTTGTF